jgi:hypothetical protein
MKTKSTRVPVGAGKYRYRIEVRAEDTPEDGPLGIWAVRTLGSLISDQVQMFLTAGQIPATFTLKYRDGAWEAVAERIFLEGDTK